MRLAWLLLLILVVTGPGCDFRKAEREALRKQAQNNLKQMKLALQAYHSGDDEVLPAEPSPTGEASAEAADSSGLAESDAAPAGDSSTVTGEVAALQHCPAGLIDGLRLADGTSIRFPSHAADAIKAVADVGEAVEVTGRRLEDGTSVNALKILNPRTGEALEVGFPDP